MIFFFLIWDRFFFRFVTNHAFDRWTDGQTDGETEFSSLDRVCIPCGAVKIETMALCCRNPGLFPSDMPLATTI